MPARHTIYTISPSPDSALALEVCQKGWSQRKYLFAFERFSGELIYDPECPLETKLSLVIQVDSLAYRHSPKGPKSDALSRLALRRAHEARTHPELTFTSRQFRAKLLRGFVVEGVVTFGGAERTTTANIGFGVEKKNWLQVDADATVRLSDWNLPRPRSILRCAHTENEAVLHALLWGQKKLDVPNSTYSSQG